MVHRISRVRGFHTHASDGSIGHVDDFIVDVESWAVRYLVIDTSNWIGGKWVAVSPAAVDKVDWVNRTIHMSISRHDVKNSPTLEETKVPDWELTPRFIIM